LTSGVQAVLIVTTAAAAVCFNRKTHRPMYLRSA
jgi:hypothetical protein